MGVFDRFINAIRINDDDYDEDEFYDDEDLDDEDDFEEDKPKKGLFSRKSGRDYDDEEEDDLYEEKRSKSSVSEKSYGSSSKNTSFTSKSSASKSAAPVKKRGISPMEVNVIKPVTMEDTREIADTLLDNCTVVLNLEGIDVDLAQRVIDFTSGACYAMGGSLQKVSSYIFILTPSSVEISGDITEILGGANFSGSDY